MWRFTGHQPGWLAAPPRVGHWETASMTNQKPSLFTCHRSFCDKHRPAQNIQHGNMGEESCILCCEDLSQQSVENIQSPCCSQAIYHRKCIQVGLFLPWGPSTIALVLCLEPEHPGRASGVPQLRCSMLEACIQGWFQAVRRKSVQSVVIPDL